MSALIFGGGSGVGGGVLGNAGRSAGAASTTQKTLTVIIKFDADGKVRDFAYHASKFRRQCRENDCMRKQRAASVLIALAVLAFGGCATIPEDALVLAPDSLERRQLQTRRIDGIGEQDLLHAAAGVLQDLGFNVDESETRLGVIVASKDRSAVTASQVAGAVLLAMLGAYTPVDKTQKIRVSLVTRPALAIDGTVRPDSQFLEAQQI